MSVTRTTTIIESDLVALVNECRKTAMKAHEASEEALANFNDAVEGLLAIARLTPSDEPGVVDLGEDGEAVMRLITATQALRQAREVMDAAE